MSEKNSTNGKKESPRSTSGDETKSGSLTSRSQSSSPRRKSSSPRRSVNKIYRTPPTPEPEVLYEKEKSFVLDCIAMYTTSNDYARAQPKLGQVVPPYNSQKDSSVKEYFKFIGVDKTLGKTGQEKCGTSIEGSVVDRFYEQGAGYKYLTPRNKNGAGHSKETVGGHGEFMSDIKPVVGWNGRFGYRRNNPWLRQVPSPFGIPTTKPIH